MKTLLKRFFFGTPKEEVNVNNIEVLKMESTYYRYLYFKALRENKLLRLKIKVYETSPTN